MTVSTRIEAAARLISLDPPPWFLVLEGVAAGAAGWRAAGWRAVGAAVWRTIRLETNGCRVERRSTASLTRAGRPELARA